MTLLEDIQNSAVDAQCDLGTLLRKCKLLAAKLGSKPLEDWLVWESNGYPENVNVPEYRIWPLELKGHFAGPYGSGIRNAPIPYICLPEKAREKFQRYECRQSIVSIEELLIANTQKGPMQVATGDLAVALGESVYEGQNCIQAWAEFSSGILIELLNSVRNRILDFSLALWKEEQSLSDSPTNSSKAVDSSQVTQIFNTTVYGGSANLVGSSNFSTIEFNIEKGDFSALDHLLRENGVEDNDIKELKSAIESDKTPASTKKFGPKVSSWIAMMVKKAAEGSWKVGLSAAGTLLGQALLKYYGLQ
jgi:hypothetical protein